MDFKGLARLEKFDGSDEHWLDWKEGFQSAMELLNLTPHLLAIDRMVEPIEFDKLTPQEQTLTKLLFTILRSCLEGRAKSIYKLVTRADGFEAWRQLLIEYEPKENARCAAMMVGIMKPRWSGRMSDFPEELRAWELAVARYQMATHAIVPDAARCSIVAMHAPPAVKACLRLDPADVLVSYAALRERIFTYLNCGRAYGDEGQLQSIPMDVDAVPRSSNRPLYRLATEKSVANRCTGKVKSLYWPVRSCTGRFGLNRPLYRTVRQKIGWFALKIGRFVNP